MPENRPLRDYCTQALGRVGEALSRIQTGDDKSPPGTVWLLCVECAVAAFCRFARQSGTALLAWLRSTPIAGMHDFRMIQFRKYRVAPRLGTELVRRRVLLGLQGHARPTATETALL
jgi:hypothetical protein